MNRCDRATGGGGGEPGADADFRLEALRRAVAMLDDGNPERTRRILELMSDMSDTPLDVSPGGAASGVPRPDAGVGLLAALGFDLHHPLLADARLLEGVEAFREHLGGKLTLTLFRGVGRPAEVHALEMDRVSQLAQGRAAVATR